MGERKRESVSIHVQVNVSVTVFVSVCVCTLWLPGGEKLPSFLHSKVREIMAFLSSSKNDLSLHSSFSLSTERGGGGLERGLTSFIKSRLACTFGRHQLWWT